MKYLVIISVVILFVGCVQTIPKVNTTFRGVSLKMQENAHDGTSELFADSGNQKVDANSVLLLKFNPPKTKNQLSLSKEWKALLTCLKLINNLQRSFESLSKQAVQMADTATDATAAFHENVQKYGNELNGLIFLLKSEEMHSIIDRNKINSLAELSATGQRDFLSLLSEFLDDIRVEQLVQAQSFTESIDSFEVSVRAYITSQFREVRQLHVPGYDNIPNRSFKPINRIALLPNEAELKKLNSEINAVEQVRQSIVKLQQNRSNIEQDLGAFADDIRKKTSSLIAEMDEFLKEWDQNTVQLFMDELSSDKEKDVVSFLRQIKLIDHDVQMMQHIQINVNNILEKINAANKNLSASIILESMDELLQIKDTLEELMERIKKWNRQFEEIENVAPNIAEKYLEKEEKNIAKQIDNFSSKTIRNAEKYTTDIIKKLLKTVQVIEIINPEFIKHGRSAVEASTFLENGTNMSIRKPLDMLQSAAVDLRRSGVTPNDIVELYVDFFDNNANTADNLPKMSFHYRAEVVLTGLHRRYSGDMIFVREITSASQKFKPNIAVSCEAHYFNRKRPNGIWNTLDVGLGFHAANLDLDNNEAIELGAGLNASIFSGFLRVGYGYNLSLKNDHQYIWIGFGLFGLLNRLNDLRMSSFPDNLRGTSSSSAGQN